MFHTFHSTLAALALTAVTTFAQAAPVVAPGSTYDFALRGEVSGYTPVPGVVFDGLAHEFTRTLHDGRTLQMTISESQDDLGGGKSRIRFDVRADGDIFPYQGPIGDLANDREYGLMGIGALGNPLDLLADVRLESAIFRVYGGDGALRGELDMIGFVKNKAPWDGVAPQTNVLFGFGNLGNADARFLQLDLVVSSLNVPEPGALALAGLGLLGLVGTRQRRA